MFCLQANQMQREQLAVINSCRNLGTDFVSSLEAREGYVPVGTVEYCEPVFGRQPWIKDFYPSFLRRFVSREITCYEPLGVNDGVHVFVKNATVWKHDTKSRVYRKDEVIPAGMKYLSEIVRFVQEWRYYVADGEVVTTGWYDGHDEDEPAPRIDVKWPKGFSGAVDFGRLDDGRIELVEAHAPYGCGWYGDDAELYAIWQAVAWEHRTWWLS